MFTSIPWSQTGYSKKSDAKDGFVFKYYDELNIFEKTDSSDYEVSHADKVMFNMNGGPSILPDKKAFCWISNSFKCEGDRNTALTGSRFAKIKEFEVYEANFTSSETMQ